MSNTRNGRQTDVSADRNHRRKLVMEPRVLAESIERSRSVQEGRGEHFSGYAVMGISFSSGYVLAMRRFPVSSMGQGYSSVWMRDPSGKWTFYQDAAPERACTRYFGKAVSKVVQSRIEVEWEASRIFYVRVPEVKLRWQVVLTENWATRTINSISHRIPNSFWQKERTMNAMEKAASAMLKTGSLTLAGTVPNGQTFVSTPRFIWLISQSRAKVKGADLGQVCSSSQQARIGNYWIPQRGLFAIADATMETYDPSRHHAARTGPGPLHQNR